MESTIAEHAFLVADQSLMQGFTHMLKADFLKQAGLSEALVNHSYQWVEKKVAFKPPMLQWQSALRNGLLEAGVLPDNGFTYDHVYGTKVYFYATVQKIIFSTKVFSRPRADGVIFEDAMGVRLWAFLTRDSKSEVILAAGMVDNPLNILFIPSRLPVELSLVSIVGITRFDSYIVACSGVSFAPSWTQRVARELASILNQVVFPSFEALWCLSFTGKIFSTKSDGEHPLVPRSPGKHLIGVLKGSTCRGIDAPLPWEALVVMVD
ncbi:Glucose-methanol-choline (GMC) oxidoreductase family protein [Theobroma cacao]|uniref:Glucose-methanol-choline (GMC) oxidoreductase family protein n=1 Tax=Theobroma cacao TaxID=3641 RepID=A0A061G1H1_THECC|nr:Glucose-methanol-choline (GMC) oxidoreductase family protein [Theobroma cacao]